MHAPRIALLSAALVLTASVDLFAQQELPVAPGDRVRVTAWSILPGRPVGTLVAIGADTCVVELEGHDEQLTLPLASVLRLEVSRGQRSNALGGALVGGLLGAGIGLFGSTIVWLNDDSDWFEDFGDAATVVGVLGGAGATIGLFLGATSYSDRWEVVDLKSVHVGLTPHGRRRLVVSMSVAF